MGEKMGENKKDFQWKTLKVLDFTGDPGGIRTPDILIRSQTLYPAELQSQLST